MSEEKTKSFAVSKEMVYNSYLKVCNKDGAAGIDKETIKMFNIDLSSNLYKVWNRMSSVHYSLVDGGSMTAPDNGIFDPMQNKWVGENMGIAPDIEQKITAAAVSKGKDLQLEKAVEETLKLLEIEPWPSVTKPPYSTPAKKK